MRIIACILTYNRCQLLERCLNHVIDQTNYIDEILVINNGSTDDTKNLLKLRKINHINLKKGGSAQGWNAAIEYSINKNFDYVWLMDDDGYPDRFALEEILKNYDNDTICISSVVLNEKNNDELVFPLPKLNSYGFPNILSKFNSIKKFSQISNNLYPFAHLFNGCLLDVNKINQVGGINLNFFHHGVELDLYYKMKKKYKVYTLKTAKHFHPDVGNRKITNMWIFYYLKNSIIINQLYLNTPLLRSLLNILITLVRIKKRNGFIDLISYIFGKNCKIFYKSIFDGFANKWSKLD